MRIPPPSSADRLRRIDLLLVGLAAAGFLLFAAHLLYSALCAFSWMNFLMMDYGAYTNFLYNLAHGDGFRYLYDHNYLKTHLSFSFVLLAPLVRLWESPLLLIFVQWSFLIGGAAILLLALRRGRVAPPLAAALLCTFAAYPMAQSVMLSEFHGVSAYFLLLPWLLHEAAFRKRWAFLPLLILLGLREDAGLIALPLLLYFSIRDRWKGGYLLSAAALAYALFALFALYPWINGTSLFDVRAHEASSASILDSFAPDRLAARGWALLWLLLPAAGLALWTRRAWLPLLVFPSFALLQALGSGMERQHSLGFHYPAAAFAALACAMALVAAAPFPAARWRIPARHLPRLAAATLLLLTAFAHSQKGFFLGGLQTQRVYVRFHPQLFPLLRLARETPKAGLLLCNQNLATYFALRPDLMVNHYADPARHVPDLIVTSIHEIQSPAFAPIVQSLANGEFGLAATQFPYLLLQRGHPTTNNPALLEKLRQFQMVPALMSGQGGDIIDDLEQGLLKHWQGADYREPLALVYGRAVQFPAGAYIAHFRLYAHPGPDGNSGTLSIHHRNQSAAIAQTPILPTADDAFEIQSLPFVLAAPALVEPRITAGPADLSLNSIRIEPAPPPP